MGAGCRVHQGVDTGVLLIMMGSKGEGMHNFLSRMFTVCLLLTVHILFAAERIVVCEMIQEET